MVCDFRLHRNSSHRHRDLFVETITSLKKIINNFNPLSLRNDVGPLWENFIIAERLKSNEILGRQANYFFWRTWDQQEIDYVEEEGGILSGWEIKWDNKSKKPPKAWAESYTNSTYQVVDKDNYLGFLS